MDPEVSQTIDLLKSFRAYLVRWSESHDSSEDRAALRASINRDAKAAQDAVTKVGCLRVVALTPPRAIGGYAFPKANPFDMIFTNYYGQSVVPLIVDMVDQAIGVYEQMKHAPGSAEVHRKQPSGLSIFISHSSSDAPLASKLIRLLRSALNLPAEAIRCSSVDGYRLPGGAETDDAIRSEIMEVPVLVGLISDASIRSTYVLFELGARWGAKKQLKPLLAHGFDCSTLRPPLAGLSALRCDSQAQMHQLVSECSVILSIARAAPETYTNELNEFLRDDMAASGSTKAAPESALNTIDAENTIVSYCEREWGGDYKMRKYCENQQRKALNQLIAPPPNDVPPEVFQQIRDQAASEWPDDFQMRLYTEGQQLSAYRELRRSGR